MSSYLTPSDLSARYSGAISVKTLANWRSLGRGPPFIKLGWRVAYALSDVLQWEASLRREGSGGTLRDPSEGVCASGSET